MKRIQSSALGGLSLLSAIAFAGSAQAQEESDWTRHFRLGATFGMNVTTEFRTSGTFAVNNSNPGDPIAGVTHTYDDGFVGVDQTGNAQGVTSNWGYSRADQYDPVGKTLTFGSTRSFTASGENKQHENPLGFELVYAATFRKWDRIAIGGEIGFGLSVFDTRDRGALTGSMTQLRDQYSTGDIVMPAPGYQGNPNGTGPVIETTPNRLGESTVNGTISGGRSLEGMLYTLRLGPMARWEFYPRWTLNGSAGAAVGAFDAEYEFNELITPAAGSPVANRGKFGDTDFTYGGYAGAVVMYDTGNFWEAYLGAHVMSMKDGEVSAPGRSARMKLGAAVFLTAGINWSF